MNRLTMIAFGMAAGFALSVYAGGSKQVRLPWATETIRVEAKGTYDGPRIQTGETDMEMQVASLRIENLTEGPLDGTVTVQSGEKKLTFPFEALPPGQVTMVMAENAEHWSRGAFNGSRQRRRKATCCRKTPWIFRKSGISPFSC